jgi:hypothetical protein
LNSEKSRFLNRLFFRLHALAPAKKTGAHGTGPGAVLTAINPL